LTEKLQIKCCDDAGLRTVQDVAYTLCVYIRRLSDIPNELCDNDLVKHKF